MTPRLQKKCTLKSQLAFSHRKFYFLPKLSQSVRFPVLIVELPLSWPVKRPLVEPIHRLPLSCSFLP